MSLKSWSSSWRRTNPSRITIQVSAMKTFIKLAAVGLLLSIAGLQSTVSAQNYSIDWYKIAGGGGTSTGGTYQVSGTIGQPDASGAMTGGNYSITGGFWAL